VEAPSADERWRPLVPRSTLYYYPPAALPSPSGKVPAAHSLTLSLSRATGCPTAAPYAPLNPLTASPAFPPELLVQRPPRCSDGDRPYLTAAAATAPNRVGRVEGRGGTDESAGTREAETSGNGRETEMGRERGGEREREMVTVRKAGMRNRGGLTRSKRAAGE